MSVGYTAWLAQLPLPVNESGNFGGKSLSLLVVVASACLCCERVELAPKTVRANEGSRLMLKGVELMLSPKGNGRA